MVDAHAFRNNPTLSRLLCMLAWLLPPLVQADANTLNVTKTREALATAGNRLKAWVDAALNDTRGR